MADFTFGIYPGGMVGSDTGLTTGKADNVWEVNKCIGRLQQNRTDFLVRVYVCYKGEEQKIVENPKFPLEYMSSSRKLDLVLCYQAEETGLDGWHAFIKGNLVRYAASIACLQITEEANVDLPSLDGHYKNSRKALVEGVIAAKRMIQELGLDIVVGFNATPDFNPDKLFWKEIGGLASAEFYQALDYVGLDFFPDVFKRIESPGVEESLEKAIEFVISEFRKDIVSAGIQERIPIHVSENGWPTSSERPESEQADKLEKIIRSIYNLRVKHSITHYELFDLRDADSSRDDIFYQFGIVRDDYSEKPAFSVYRKLIQELT